MRPSALSAAQPFQQIVEDREPEEERYRRKEEEDVSPGLVPADGIWRAHEDAISFVATERDADRCEGHVQEAIPEAEPRREDAVEPLQRAVCVCNAWVVREGDVEHHGDDHQHETRHKC